VEVAGGAGWQRLDVWLWCARLAKTRAECSRQVAGGCVRINRQPTDKPHAKLRPGDVLTLTLGGQVRVWRVLDLAARRGPAAEARTLYEDLSDPA
jgi:ribosome-associated heat shock protein Hsp15